MKGYYNRKRKQNVYQVQKNMHEQNSLDRWSK